MFYRSGYYRRTRAVIWPMWDPIKLLFKNYRESPWFKSVMERGIYISDVFTGFRNVPHFVIAVRQSDPDGTWILRAHRGYAGVQRGGGRCHP